MTEAVTGVDLVEVMLAVAGGDGSSAMAAGDARRGRPRGRGPAVRRGPRPRASGPSTGLLTEVAFPAGRARVDTWVDGRDRGTAPYYDPAAGQGGGPRRRPGGQRSTAWPPRSAADRVHGVETNRELASAAVLADPAFRAGGPRHRVATTADAGRRSADGRRSMASTRRGDPCRTGRAGSATGRWAFRRAGRWTTARSGSATGSWATAAARRGWSARSHGPDAAVRPRRVVCLAAARTWRPRSTAGPVPRVGSRWRWRPGRRCACGAVAGPARGPTCWCGAASTSPRIWAAGRRSPSAASAATAGVPCGPATSCAFGDDAGAGATPAPARRPTSGPDARRRSGRRRARRPPRRPRVPDRRGHGRPLRRRWEVHVQLGPHRRAPRSGPRPRGPAPTAARPACTRRTSTTPPTRFGAVDLTGDMPVILGPDGPSLGGFVCPVTVAADERWKLGQLAAGRHASGSCPGAGHRRDEPGRRCRRPDRATPRPGGRGGPAAGRRHLPAQRATATCWSSTASRCSTSTCGCGSTLLAAAARGGGRGRHRRRHARHPLAAGPRRRRRALRGRRRSTSCGPSTTSWGRAPTCASPAGSSTCR